MCCLQTVKDQDTELHPELRRGSLAGSANALEAWLRDEVAPTYDDRAMAEPQRLLNLGAVFDGIREGLRTGKASAAE